MSTLETGIVTHPTVGPDWDRYFERDMGRGNQHRPDREVWRDMTRLAVAADDLGYDFVFAPEHHVSPYGLSPDPLQWMTFIAGRTKRINLATSVIVLPWHHPLRVAEQMTLLDNLAPERRKWFGVGRGQARFEYEALQVPLDDRRERFDESVEIIQLALGNEVFSYDGAVFQLPEITLRPRPVNPDLRDRILVTATSDETLVAGGKRGLGLLYAGQKSTDLVRRDLQLVNRERVAIGLAPTQPLILAWMVCCESEQEAYDRMAGAFDGLLFELVNNYAQTVWDSVDRDAGYDAFVQSTKDGSNADSLAVIDKLIDGQIWGTPEQCLERVRALQEGVAATNISFQIQFGNITNQQAIGSLDLFARSCLDRLHTIPTSPPGWIAEDVRAAVPV